MSSNNRKYKLKYIRQKNVQTIWQPREEDKVETKLADVVDLSQRTHLRAKTFNSILSWQWGRWWYFDEEKVYLPLIQNFILIWCVIYHKNEEIHDNLSCFHNIMSQNYLENNLNI